MSDSPKPITIRVANSDDVRYIRHAMTRAIHGHQRSLHYLGRQGPCTPFAVHEALFGRVLDAVLARAVALVAVDPNDERLILGYAITESDPNAPALIWYVQVRDKAWRNGIASRLLAHVGITKDTNAVYAFPSPVLAPGKIERPNWTHVSAVLIPPKEHA